MLSQSKLKEKYDNRQPTAYLKWAQMEDGEKALLQMWKCWHSSDPLHPVELWIMVESF